MYNKKIALKHTILVAITTLALVGCGLTGNFKALSNSNDLWLQQIDIQQIAVAGSQNNSQAINHIVQKLDYF